MSMKYLAPPWTGVGREGLSNNGNYQEYKTLLKFTIVKLPIIFQVDLYIQCYANQNHTHIFCRKWPAVSKIDMEIQRAKGVFEEGNVGRLARSGIKTS